MMYIKKECVKCRNQFQLPTHNLYELIDMCLACYDKATFKMEGRFFKKQKEQDAPHENIRR